MILKYVVIVCTVSTILNTYAMNFTAKLRDLKHAKALSEQNIARFKIEVTNTIEQSVKEVSAQNERRFKHDCIMQTFKLDAVEKIINTKDEYGQTLMMLATEYGLLSLLQCLQEYMKIEKQDTLSVDISTSYEHDGFDGIEILSTRNSYSSSPDNLKSPLEADIQTSAENFQEKNDKQLDIPK